jgi:hypothetical protein
MPSYTPRASIRRRENRSRRFNADVAQLVEQLTRNEQVVRSNRIISSTLIAYLERPAFRRWPLSYAIHTARVGHIAAEYGSEIHRVMSPRCTRARSYLGEVQGLFGCVREIK